MEKIMKRTLLILIALSLLMTFSVLAEEKTKIKEDWKDITKAVMANPANKGGWTADAAGKVYCDEAGSKIKVVHSEFGTFLVNLQEKKVYKLDGEKKALQDNPLLIQRDFGTSLVVKLKDYKFRLKFTEAVAGMKNIEGIKGM